MGSHARQHVGQARLAQASQEDQELATYIRQAKKLYKPLERTALEHLIRLAQGGAQYARDHLTELHLLLVVTIAKAYIGVGLETLDLIMAGNTGLLEAIEAYELNHESAASFSTFAADRIRGAISHAVADEGATVRLPYTSSQQLTRITRAANSGAVYANDKALAKAANVSPRTVKRLAKAPIVFSMDNSYAQRVEVTLADTLPDDRASAPFTRLESQEARQELVRRMAALDPTEQQVVLLHVVEGMAFEKLSRRFSKSREWARNIYNHAMQKLRAGDISAMRVS